MTEQPTIEQIALEIAMARSAQRHARTREVFDGCRAEIERLETLLHTLQMNATREGE